MLTFDLFRGTCLSLAHLDVAVAVRSRYMKGSGDQEPSLHRLMAGYFLQLVDPERDGSYTGNSVRAFSELPYHLVRTVDRGIDKMIDLLIFLLFYSSFTKWFFWKLICNNFSRLLINDFVLFTVRLNFWGWKYYFTHYSRQRIHWRGFCYTMYIYLHFICHVFYPTGLWWGF